MKTDEQQRRDLEDIGRILQGLLNTTDAPADLAKRHLAKNRFKNTAPKAIDVGFPGLALARKAIVAAGGGGIVMQCVLEKEPRVKYALKITRPSLVDKLETLAESQQLETAEFLKHAPLSHRNVRRVYGAGSIELEIAGAKVPLHPILMEWIDDPASLCEYLATAVGDWQTVVDILAQSFDGLAHLHDAQLIHWDIKSDNILVDRRGVPRVSDMGSARRRDAKNRDYAFSTRWNLPPDVALDEPTIEPDEQGKKQQSNRRTRVKVAQGWDEPWLDLWMLARDLNRLFEADWVTLSLDTSEEEALRSYPQWRDDFLNNAFPDDDDPAQYALRYIRIILRRLLAPLTPSHSRFYHDATRVADDLRKLLHPLGAARNVPELHDVPQHVLRLPVWGNAPYTPRFGDLYNSRLVRRLSNHLQLGGLVHVYPGAAHRRFEHSAGVFATVIAYVRALYANQADPFWRLNVEETDVNALLVAALLHDIGHIAFGHFLEEMEGLFRERMHEAYAAAVFAPEPPASADGELTADRDELREIIRPWCGDAEVQAFLYRVSTILHTPEPTDALTRPDAVLLPDATNELKDAVLHSIIDSAIDADKLDYLARDAHHCNVQYAKGVDTERFFQSLTAIAHIPDDVIRRIEETREREELASTRRKPNACIAVTGKGIAPVESVLLARYQMFSVVYWHHTARAQTAVLHFVAQEWIASEPHKWEDRFDALVTAFRNKSDGEALRWLGEQVSKPKRIKPPGLRKNLVDMCEALLGDRQRLHRSAFELQYRPDATDARMVAMRWMERVDELNQRAGYEYVQGMRAMRVDLAAELERQLPGRIAFRPGDVLIDVPPAGKDQVDNVFVVADAVRQIQDISPLANAVRDAFRFWVRKLRVFLSPAAWKQCERAGFSRVTVRDACWRALDPQGNLFPEAATRKAPRPAQNKRKRRSKPTATTTARR